MSSRRVRGGLLAACAAGALVALSAAPVAAAAQTPVTPSSEWWLTGSYDYSAVWPTTQGANTRVAVIGPPVDASLPSLSGSLMPALSYPPNAGNIDTNGATGTCYSTQSATLIAADSAPGSSANTAFAGVAPQAKILPITVPTMHGELISDSASTAQAITAAVSLKVNVIDVDMPAPDSPALTAAVKKALAAGIVVVAPTGDEWETHRLSSSPGDVPGVLDVTAVDSSGVVPWEAGSADTPDLAAPGSNVPAVNSGGNLKAGHSGTSCAAAIAAGTVALVESAHPTWTSGQVISALLDSASGHGRVVNDALGYGLINPGAAVKATPAANAPNPLSAALGSPAVSAATPAPTGGSSGKGGGSSILLILLLCVGVLILALLTVLLVRRIRSRPSKKSGYVFSEPAPYLGTGPQSYEETAWPEQQPTYFPDAGWQQHHQPFGEQFDPEGAPAPAMPAVPQGYEGPVDPGVPAPPPEQGQAGVPVGYPVEDGAQVAPPDAAAYDPAQGPYANPAPFVENAAPYEAQVPFENAAPYENAAPFENPPQMPPAVGAEPDLYAEPGGYEVPPPPYQVPEPQPSGPPAPPPENV